MILLDAKNGIAGRIAAKIAKELLKGNDVRIVNVEEAFISGSPGEVVNKYYKRRQMTQKANPETAAKWPRKPDLFFKKIITGMLPKHSSRQKDALAKLRVYVGVPKELQDEVKNAAKPEKLISEVKGRSISVKDICHRLGFRNGSEN